MGAGWAERGMSRANKRESVGDPLKRGNTMCPKEMVEKGSGLEPKVAGRGQVSTASVERSALGKTLGGAVRKDVRRRYSGRRGPRR